MRLSFFFRFICFFDLVGFSLSLCLSISIFSGEPSARKIRQIDPSLPLLDILKQPDYVLPGELPVFLLVVRGSAYQKEFLSKYKKVFSLPITA